MEHFGSILEPKRAPKVYKNGAKKETEKKVRKFERPGGSGAAGRTTNDKIAVEAGTLEAEESEEFEAKFRTRPAPLRGAADLKA